MKSILIVISVFLFSASGLIESPNDFDYRLSGIVRKFKSEIMDKDECEKQKRAANNLSVDIEDAIRNTDKYNSDEIIELKKLKKEADALEEFIAAVGNCGIYIPSINNFHLANKRVGGSISSIIKDKFCVDVISVTIGDYVAYLCENNSTKNYTVTYKWKAPNGRYTGNGTMGLSGKSIRHFYDNREEPNQKNISVFGITCEEF